MNDLVERLAEAAADAVRNRRAALESDPARLKSLTVELEVSGLGTVVHEVECYVGFRGRPRRLQKGA